MAFSLINLVVGAASAACVAVGPGDENNVIVVAKADKASSLQATNRKSAQCAPEMKWDGDAARQQCASYRHWTDEVKGLFQEHYGISTDEICAEGREAAGLSRKAEDGEMEDYFKRKFEEQERKSDKPTAKSEEEI